MVTAEAVRDTRTYNAYFGTTRFTDVAGVFESGKIDNSYRLFSAGGRDWMVLSLELWPRPAAVAWAAQVVATHPTRNVILLTHSYLEADGSISASNGGYGATAPTYLFEQLVRRYPNVKIVLSGHTGAAASRVDVGWEGNRVVSMLTAYHSMTTNPVRFVEIDVIAGTVTSDIVGPATQESLQDRVTVSGLTWAH